MTEPTTAAEDSPEDGFSGAATLIVGGSELPVEVVLRGYFEPVDGRYHWYGRIAANEVLAALVGTSKADGVLRTPHGEATGQLGDVDPWGRYRISGVSTPPFQVTVSLSE